MVRELCSVIFGHLVVSLFRSIIMLLTPCFARENAESSPAGPAPTINTGTETSDV